MQIKNHTYDDKDDDDEEEDDNDDDDEDDAHANYGVRVLCSQEEGSRGIGN